MHEQDQRFADFVQGHGVTRKQHPPATHYPVDAFPIPQRGYDFLTGAIIFADQTVLVHVRPDAAEEDRFTVMPASEMVMRMPTDRVDVSAKVPSEGAMQGVYSMRDVRRLECGGIEASLLPAPLASEADEAVACSSDRI